MLRTGAADIDAQLRANSSWCESIEPVQPDDRPALTSCDRAWRAVAWVAYLYLCAFSAHSLLN